MKSKFMRKLLAVCVSAAMVSGIGSSALAFSDVGEGSPYAEAVAVLEENRITTGRSSDIFDPADSLTTAQLVTFLGRIAAQDLPAVAEGITDDGWSGAYMTWALEKGLIDESFGQYATLDAESVNTVLAAFCEMQAIEPVTVTAADVAVTRGEAAIALAAIVTAEPAETEEPADSEEPAENEEPADSEEPAENEEPADSEEPAENEEPADSEEPAENEEPSEEDKENVEMIEVKYTTIATGEDWGPAVTKVILNLGTEIDPESVSAEKFTASSVRTVPGFNFETMEAAEPAPQVVERAVTDAYVCDENGEKAETGSCIALELEVTPASDASSPFYYDYAGTGHNIPVAHTYEIALAEGETLTNAEGTELTFEATDAEGLEAAVVELADDFTKDTYTWNAEEGDEGITLSYASWMPQEEAEEGSTPLIIWLHGAGEGGTDPVVALVGNKVVNLTTETIQKHFGETGAAVLAPQTPTFWMDNGEGEYLTAEDESGRSIYTDALMALIENFVENHPEIDANRIYIGGCSNGGYMTVNMITEFPAYFAAAYPVCEAYDAAWLTDEMVEAIKDMPIWLTAAKNDGTVVIFEGEADPDNFMVYNLKLDNGGNAIPVDNFSNNLYNRLVEAGAENVYYSLFEDVHDMTGLYNNAEGEPYQYMGHWSWLYTLNDQCVETIDGEEVTLFQWLADQSK